MSWVLAIAVAVFGAIGTVTQVDSYELDPATGTYASENTGVAYFSWMLASLGEGAAVFILLSNPRPLWMDPPRAAVARMRRSCLTLSSAVFFLVFGIGSVSLNVALMRSPFDGAWVPLVVGLALTFAGLLLPGKRALWDIDEDSEGRDAGTTARIVGPVIIVLGLVIMVVSFAVGLAVTSTYYGTNEWYDRPYASYIIVSHLAGLFVVLGGVAVYAGRGDAPFPHWRVNYRPPGVD